MNDAISFKPGVDAETHSLIKGKLNADIAFDFPIEQKARHGLRGSLRIEARPWT